MSYHPPDQEWPGAHSQIHPVSGHRLPPPRNWPVVIGSLAAVVLVCGGGLFWLLGIGKTDPSDQPSGGVVQTPTTIGPPPSTPAPPHKPVGISDGTWEVGVDIPPGKFKTSGAENRSILMCYWDVRTGSETGAFVAQGVINKLNAPGRVTLKKGQFFTTSGCDDWKPI
jgi:hypothetical protein